MHINVNLTIAYAHTNVAGKALRTGEIVKGWKINELAGCHFFGDSTVLLPSAAVLFIVLFLRKDSKQLARHWALLFGITGAIVCASKLAFMGWGIGIRELDFTGFSGHTALSSAFWPILLWLLCARATPALRFTAVIVGYALAGLVGYSRLMGPRTFNFWSHCRLTAGSRRQRNFSAATVTRSRHSYSTVILWQSGEHGDDPGASAEYGGEGADAISAEWDCGEDWPTGKPLPGPICISDFTDSDKRGKDEGFRKNHVVFTLYAIWNLWWKWQ